MLNNKKISIICPVYNEEESFPELYTRIKKSMQNYNYDIIMVDDGSTDNSFKILKEYAEKDNTLKIISFKRNYGKTIALNNAFKLTDADIVVTLDADLQDLPENIPLLIEKMKEGYDIVVGYRKNRNDKLFKIMISKIFNLIFSFTAKHKFKDINSGLKAMSKKCYKNLNLFGDLHRFIPFITVSKGFKIYELPVEHSERKYGKSKYSLVRMRGLWDLIMVSVLYSQKLRPFHFFGGWGFLISFLSLISLGTLFVLNVSDLKILLTSMLFFIIGQFLILGGFLADLLLQGKTDALYSIETLNTELINIK